MCASAHGLTGILAFSSISASTSAGASTSTVSPIPATASSSAPGNIAVAPRATPLPSWPPEDSNTTRVAEVDRVIDGDSIHVNVHCGFGHERLETLRLRAIDTPELSTRAGQRARQFVTDELADVDFVVITTTRRDNYRRYLAEIFYLPGESDPEVVLRKGVFLNRRLLEERLAIRYSTE